MNEELIGIDNIDSSPIKEEKDENKDKVDNTKEYENKESEEEEDDNKESEEEDDKEEEEEEDTKKKKKKGKKKKKKKKEKKLKKLLEQQQKHSHEDTNISSLNEEKQATLKDDNNNNDFEITIPSPPILLKNVDQNPNYQVTTPNTEVLSSANTSTNLLLPPPPQKVIMKSKKDNEKSTYESKKEELSKIHRRNLSNTQNTVSHLLDNSLINEPTNSNFNSMNRNEVPLTSRQRQQQQLQKTLDAGKIPVWRKVLSDDSKLFSNERTWMSWVGLTFSLGAIGTAIITFFGTENLTLFTGVSLWVIALGFLIYSYVIFRKRRTAILNKTRGPFYDPYGPVVMVVSVMLSVILFLVFFIIRRPEAQVST